jgi:hypothetical protein
MPSRNLPTELSRTQKKALQKQIRVQAAAQRQEHRGLRWMGQVVLCLIAFVGGGVFVDIYRAHPNVAATHFDAKDPFRFPFEVSNQDLFVTFHKVTIVCELSLPDVIQKPGLQVWGQHWTETLGPSFDLAPDGNRPFPIPLHPSRADVTPLPQHLAIQITIHWKTLHCPRQRSSTFIMIKDSDGTPYWISGSN